MQKVYFEWPLYGTHKIHSIRSCQMILVAFRKHCSDDYGSHKVCVRRGRAPLSLCTIHTHKQLEGVKGELCDSRNHKTITEALCTIGNVEYIHSLHTCISHAIISSTHSLLPLLYKYLQINVHVWDKISNLSIGLYTPFVTEPALMFNSRTVGVSLQLQTSISCQHQPA